MIKYTKYSNENNFSYKHVDEMLMYEIPKGRSLSIFKRFFHIYWEKQLFWFRFLDGYGINGVSNKKKRFVPFSERNGITNRYKILGWSFLILKPFKS